VPGPIAHLVVEQRLSPYLRRLKEERGEPLAKLLEADPCSPYAGFGAQGPDFLIFSLKEYGTPLDELANFLFGVYDALRPLIEFYETTIEPVVDSIEDALAALDEVLFDSLFKQIGETATLITATAITAAEVVVTKNIDLFYPFYPKVQQGKPENEWYWFDTLHYRRTGDFASNMWKLAQGNNDLMRYVIGYGSHIGTDVAAHPFVNTLVGGPYRMHWHRHHLIENWIDAYSRKHYGDAAGTKNCLALGPDDVYRADAISGSYAYRLCAFPDERLPDDLASLLVQAVTNTYGGTVHPPLFSETDFDTTYRLWLMWFEWATSIGDAIKPTPVPPPGSGLATLFSDYVGGFPSFPGGGGGGGGGFSIWGVFAAIFGFVKWLVDVLTYTTEWIVTHSVDIFLLPYTEALGFVKWLLYQIQKGVWEIYDNLRFALVLGAYLPPEPRDLAKSPWAAAFLDTGSVQLTGGPPASFLNYPRKQEVHGLFGPIEHHLPYPGTLPEYPHAEPEPIPFLGVTPDRVLTGSNPYDPYIEHLYEAISPYGGTDQYTHHVDQNSWSTSQLGSALYFTTRLLADRIDRLPNFNLDADRGYGWKTWRADDPENINDNNPVDVKYVDAGD
jgi:hypothetical protein